MFHATTLVFFTGFPAWQQKGDAIYYASYYADKTFNPFVPYPIVGFYFILLTLVLIGFFTLTHLYKKFIIFMHFSLYFLVVIIQFIEEESYLNKPRD